MLKRIKTTVLTQSSFLPKTLPSPHPLPREGPNWTRIRRLNRNKSQSQHKAGFTWARLSVVVIVLFVVCSPFEVAAACSQCNPDFERVWVFSPLPSFFHTASN